MNSRSAFETELKNLGYNFSYENNVIMVIVSEHEYKDNLTHIAITNAAHRANYQGSRGIRPRRKEEDVRSWTVSKDDQSDAD